jgi:threonine/homoserine/homoserine lactone efflux protein
MLLQIAVGPVCVFIFNIATSSGFWNAEAGVLSVVIIDALFILLAIFGIASFIEKENVRKVLKYFGSLILFLFGLNIGIAALSLKFLPTIKLLSNPSDPSRAFISGIVLTASNPLTIVFWSGVFSAKVAAESMNQKELYLFGAGAILSTLIFLTLISFLGSITNKFLPLIVVNILNGIVGALLIFFSIKMFIRKN